MNRMVFRLEEPRNSAPSRYGYLGVEGGVEETRNRHQAAPGSNRYGEGSRQGSGANGVPDPSSAASGRDIPARSVTAPGSPPKNPGSSAGSKGKKPGNRPYADPVPGKYGRVYSPFAKGKEVDVSEFPPGTLVRCPYTQKIFKVP
ncbi:MAG: hypothetical protein VCA55_13580 [Verrucomicrobiales bacterium]